MHISKFRLKNYKSFHDSDDLNLNEGINIITGQNNAGKTALIQGLSLEFRENKHRSIKTLPNSISNIQQLSEAIVEFDLSLENLKTYIFDHLQVFDFPLLKSYNIDALVGQNFFTKILRGKITISCDLTNGVINSGKIKNLDYSNNGQFYRFNVDRNNKSLVAVGQIGSGNSIQLIANKIKERIYTFQAERLNIGNSNFGSNPILANNASNLPEVLNILQGDKIRFDRYNLYVRKIFPQIFRISTRPIDTSQVQIVVWNEDPKLERSDLVVPLSGCGTGLGQVLAILYVVLTSDISKVIIIDEPNSFLHPGASRKLIEILKEHPQHQFIISTHSPSTIAAANPKSIHIVRNKNAQSYVEEIDVQEVNNQQLYLAEIGSKLSDVFGADNILWVEGKTEEICISRIIEKIKDISLMGTAVLSVINTGDFQKKRDADLIFSIYEKLSSGKGFVPPALAFLFDSEKLSEKDKADLTRKSVNKVIFTKRKMFENYLLNPNAIFEILSKILEIAELNLTLDKITKTYDSIKWNKEFISQKFISAGQKEEDWLTNVDGAKFLNKLFSEVTDQRLSFDKIKHSVALCDWVLENSIDDLSEIQEILKSILGEK